LYSAETWSLQGGEQKCLERIEMWCWRMTKNISWTDRVRNEEKLQRLKEVRNIHHAIKGRKVN
jgi:hypothetical protein